MKTNRMTRLVMVGLCAALLCAVGTAASAQDEIGNQGVAVTLYFETQKACEELQLSVAGDEAPLGEVPSANDELRQFEGELPEVKVCDPRETYSDSDAGWYVVGQATDFVEEDGAAPNISADQLGWQPKLVEDNGSGDVSQGQLVQTRWDEPTDPDEPDNLGLVSGDDLLYMAKDASSATGPGVFKASADLVLKIDAETAGGAYASALTLTLFE